MAYRFDIETRLGAVAVRVGGLTTRCTRHALGAWGAAAWRVRGVWGYGGGGFVIARAGELGVVSRAKTWRGYSKLKWGNVVGTKQVR
jgi:hypothetical protein